MAKASADEPFSIRGFATRMRAIDAAECHPFGGKGCWVEGEGKPPAPPPLPPMDPAPRSRWWKHELMAVRARLSAGGKGGETATLAGEGGALRKGTKRKESRSSSAAERAKKRRRVLQFRSFLKNKEKTSTSRLHQHMLHMALLRKHRSSAVCTSTELESRKQMDAAWDCMLPHENSVNKQSRERMDPCSEIHSNLFRRMEQNSSVNKQGIGINGLTNYPTDTDCEVVKHATGPKDDIFGDLPLLELESSKVMFRTAVDELPTVIEESFIASQSEADSIPEAVPLRLIDASDITGQTPSPLEDLAESEVTPDNVPAFVSHSNVAESQTSTVQFNGLPHDKNISVVKPGFGDIQLKFNGSALSSHSDLMPKCGSSNPLQGYFDANKNFSREIKKHGIGSTTSSPTMRTRTEATRTRSLPAKECIPSTRPSGSFRSNVDLCAPLSTDKCKKNTDISGAVAVVALPAPINRLSSQVSVLPSAVSQWVFNSRTNANDISSLKSMPAKECIPSTRPSSNFRSNADPCSRPPTRPSSNFRSNVDPCSPPSTNKGKSTDISGAVAEVALPGPVSHLPSHVNVLPSVVSQGVFNTRTNANDLFSFNSMPAKECIPFTQPSGNFRSNVDPCAPPSTKKGKKSTDISGAVVEIALPGPVNHLSSHVNVLPSEVTQRVFNTRTNANDVSSFRSMPAKECIPSTGPSGNFRSIVDPCVQPSTEKGKKSTDISGAVAAVTLPASVNHHSSQVNVLPSEVSQWVFNTRTNANDVSSFRSMPAKECVPSTGPSGDFRSNVDPCVQPSTEKGKKSTDVSGAVAAVTLSASVNHHLSHVNVSPSEVSQGVFNTRTNANDVSSFRSMPAKECIPCTRPSGNSRPSGNQGSWQSKHYPSCSPANIGMAFMKLPGLERMEISNCNVKIGENKFRSAQSMNTVRHQKQQLVSGMTNVMQGQKKIVLNNSQAGKTVLDGRLGQDDHHMQQPTVRLMGKTVSVCNHSNDHNVPTTGKVSPDNIPVKANYLSATSCQLPQKRSFRCEDSVTSTVHLNGSSDFLTRIPNSSVSGQNTTFSDFHNHRPQSRNAAASTMKDRTWNFSSHFVHQAEQNKASMVSANSKTRHLELYQPPHLISIPPDQQSHLWTPGSHMSRKDHGFLGSAANQRSPVPQSSINASMKEKYQKSNLLSYDDPSSVPIRQHCQIPQEKLSSASDVSFLDYGADNSLSRSSSPGLSLSLTTGLAHKSVSTGRPTCAGNLTNTDGRKDAGSANPVSNGPAYTDNFLQQPAKRQLVAGGQDFMSMDLNIVNHSPGWSLSDAVGPRVLDFSRRISRDVVQTAKNESNNSRSSSGPGPLIETRSRVELVAGANTMLRPGQNLNDHSKVLYSTKFSVDNGINSVVL